MACVVHTQHCVFGSVRWGHLGSVLGRLGGTLLGWRGGSPNCHQQIKQHCMKEGLLRDLTSHPHLKLNHLPYTCPVAGRLTCHATEHLPPLKMFGRMAGGAPERQHVAQCAFAKLHASAQHSTDPHTNNTICVCVCLCACCLLSLVPLVRAPCPLPCIRKQCFSSAAGAWQAGCMHGCALANITHCSTN